MGFLSKLFGQDNSKRKLSKREFTEQLAQELQQAVPDTQVRVVDADKDDEISIHIEHENSQANIVYPDNLYASYVQERPDFEAYKQNVISNVYDVYYGEEENATLLPNIKHINWVQEIEQVSAQAQSDAPPNRLVTFPFAGDLVVVIAMDYPSKMAYLFEADLPDYTSDGSKDTALQQALDNLRAHKEDIEVTSFGNTWQRIGLDQTYDAGLVLLWEEIAPQLELGSAPVLALIARDQFIVVDGNSPDDIAALQRYAAEEIQETPYALSAQLYCYRNGRIGLYESLQ